MSKVAEYERSDDWRAEGYVSAANALRHACRMNPVVTRGHVELARKLETLPHHLQRHTQEAEARARGANRDP